MNREDLIIIIRQLSRHHEFDAQDIISIFTQHTTISKEDLEAVIKVIIEGK